MVFPAYLLLCLPWERVMLPLSDWVPGWGDTVLPSTPLTDPEDREYLDM